MATRSLSPLNIMQTGLGFWASKTLLSAVELGLFTELSKGPLEAEALRKRLDLHQRSARDFFDAMVALGMLKRTGVRYANTPEADEVAFDAGDARWAGGTDGGRAAVIDGTSVHLEGTTAVLLVSADR